MTYRSLSRMTDEEREDLERRNTEARAKRRERQEAREAAYEAERERRRQQQQAEAERERRAITASLRQDYFRNPNASEAGFERFVADYFERTALDEAVAKRNAAREKARTGLTRLI